MSLAPHELRTHTHTHTQTHIHVLICRGMRAAHTHTHEGKTQNRRMAWSEDMQDMGCGLALANEWD